MRGTFYTMFYASTNKNFVAYPNPNGLEDQYASQVGYIKCEEGWIDNILVNFEAQKCGISTVLAFLCMIDSDINAISRRNKAFQELDEDENIRKEVQGQCSGFMGLQFIPKEKRTAFTYFSAAEKSGYNYLYIWHMSRFKRLPIEWAKANYDELTGNIGNIQAYSKNWLFCKWE